MEEKKENGKSEKMATKEQGIPAINQATIVDMVGDRVEKWIANGQITLPGDYDVNTAMKFAWLELQTVKDLGDKPLFVDGKLDETVGTRNSLINALLTMAVQGLNVGKDQGYFIIFAKQVTFMRSYFGTERVAIMVQPKIASFASNVIREGDEVTYDLDNGRIKNLVHKTSWENRNKAITGAYAVAFDIEGKPFSSDIMSTEEIHASWKMSKAKPFDDNGKLKPTSRHAQFPVEFSKRTVLDRLCKPVINTSTDKALLRDMIKRSSELADSADVQEEIQENANKGPVIDVTTDKIAIEPAANSVDTFKTLMHEAPDFQILNGFRKAFFESDLSAEEKKDLQRTYQAEAKRLQRPKGQEQPDSDTKEEAPKEEPEQKRGPGF